MQLIVISGRSGSGKSTALDQLEDEGYYCIDNLPIALLPALVTEANREDFDHLMGAAVCIDARNALRNLGNFEAILNSLPPDIDTKVLFLDAEENVLIKRFSETRRRHPLTDDATPLAEALKRERRLLETISDAATLTLDTSQLTIYELRDAIRQRLIGKSGSRMAILFQSFGFKRGIPMDADLVFDVRMLPNPHWVKELRLHTGLDADVARFLEAQELTGELFDDLCHYLDKWLPRYRQSNRSYMTVALGCTGGRHRSVYLADRLYNHYRNQYPELHIRHRELQ